MEHMLVQRITVNGQYEVDMALLQTCTYVETLDLSGPRLMLTFQDRDNLIRDDYGLVENAEIEVTFNDRHMRGGIDLVEKFVMRSVSGANNETVKMAGFAKPIHDLKTPTAKALFVNAADAAGVITRNVPGAKVLSDALPVMGAWHLLPGERPSRKLRMMGRELGAAVYYLRNEFCIKSLKTLFEQEPFAEFHHNDNRQDNQIISYKSTYRKDLSKERMRRSFVGWNMVDGLIRAVKNEDAPIEMARFGEVPTLDAMNTYLTPAIDFGTNGWGELKPGVCVAPKIHRVSEGKPYDESVPEKVLLYEVAHHYAVNKYECRVKGGVVNE